MATSNRMQLFVEVKQGASVKKNYPLSSISIAIFLLSPHLPSSLFSAVMVGSDSWNANGILTVVSPRPSLPQRHLGIEPSACLTDMECATPLALVKPFMQILLGSTTPEPRCPIRVLMWRWGNLSQRPGCCRGGSSRATGGSSLGSPSTGLPTLQDYKCSILNQSQHSHPVYGRTHLQAHKGTHSQHHSL